MKRKLILFSLALLTVNATGCSKEKNERVEGTEIESSIQGDEVADKEIERKKSKIIYNSLQMNVPKQWKKSLITDGMEMYSKQDKKTIFSIVKTNSEVLDAEQYFSKIKRYIKDEVTTTNVRDEKLEIKGTQCLPIKYQYNVNNEESEVYQVYVLEGESAYILTMLTLEDDYEKEFEDMDEIIESIKVKK